MALTLSTAAKVAKHLDITFGPDNPDEDLEDSLLAARDLIASRVDDDLFDAEDPPAALHRAAMLLAAELYARAPGVANVSESFTAGVGVLMYRPVIKDLLSPYMAAPVGGATRSDD